ncbi:hypothetical protein B0H19DRAFT_1160262 [Mycena capillaripes]|nr:hypothetical protein B0H19DRAFT_1160262 [Mycena capillaripes]
MKYSRCLSMCSHSERRMVSMCAWAEAIIFAGEYIHNSLERTQLLTTGEAEQGRQYASKINCDARASPNEVGN